MFQTTQVINSDCPRGKASKPTFLERIAQYRKAIK